MTLPPLPAPHATSFYANPLFTDDQMLAYGAACAAAERESLRDEAAALLRELLAEPQGEPVAWLYESKSGSSFLHRGFTKVRFEADMRASKEYPDGHTMTPLYTHPPPQHKQISDEVVAKLINAEWATSDVPSAWKFARAIERAITGEPT